MRASFSQTIELAQLQITSVIVALRKQIEALERTMQEEPVGGEHEDLLIATECAQGDGCGRGGRQGADNLSPGPYARPVAAVIRRGARRTHPAAMNEKGPVRGL